MVRDLRWQSSDFRDADKMKTATMIRLCLVKDTRFVRQTKTSQGLWTRGTVNESTNNRHAQNRPIARASNLIPLQKRKEPGDPKRDWHQHSPSLNMSD
ncbi:hypothetical protein E4U52_001654 [Claviceps spartinae]|nr:hypothetical protein E4U52_001654 [Claviceps spartinae]